jgi:hypothetical protein
MLVQVGFMPDQMMREMVVFLPEVMQRAFRLNGKVLLLKDWGQPFWHTCWRLK